MKLRTIGAVLAGAAMIGATVAGAAAAATVPAKSWWIDPATGAPNVTIAVGAQANASDVVSASLIAAAVGNMATVEETASVPVKASVTWDKVGDYNYTIPKDFVSYTTNSCDSRDATWYTDFDLLGWGYWRTQDNELVPGYNSYVQIAAPKDLRITQSGTDWTVAKGLSTLWFSNSPKEWDANNRIYKVTTTSGAGSSAYFLENTKYFDGTAFTNTDIPEFAKGSYDNGNGAFDWNYGFFSTRAWVNIPNEGCDYNFGGTGTEMEAHEEIQLIFTSYDCSACSTNGLPLLRGDEGVESGIVYRTTEIRYPLLENGQNICGIKKCWGMIDFETTVKGRFTPIKFLGKMYQPMFAGATYDTDYGYLGAYFMYGKPYAEAEKILKVGDVYNFHGWTVTLNDVNIYENKAYITVAGPALTSPFSFIMVMDSQFNDCDACCPDCAVYGGGGSFTSNPTRRTEYDPYVKYTTVTKTKDDRPYNYFRYVNFMLDGIKTFVGADGTYLAEFNLYAIEDYGYLEDKGCCDPFVTTPNDYGLAITGGWRQIANITMDDEYLAWEDVDLAVDTYTKRIVQWMPAPMCGGYCPDANFDTLELRLCDTIKIPDCETSYTVNGPENYFTVEVLDVDFGKDNAIPDYFDPYFAYVGYKTKSAPNDEDGLRARISMTSAGQTIKYTANVKIDPVELIKLDIEVNTATNTKNLVLVGGPVYNSIVKDLVDMGASTVDWATSAGEWEWIADPMARGYDVLIVAGANREETRMAAEDLVAMLN
ncbi:MAG: S-layer protein [Candidatus Methanofastidiosum sp.]|nr:S-layer protein [Methanofastidiosum sp.]